MIAGLLLPLALVFAFPQAAQVNRPQIIRQTTSGWCSPVIANVTGNVTVNCIGVDPRALKRLNQLLDRKSMELNAKIEEANKWADGYHELENRLNESGTQTELSRQAEGFLEQGELEKAKAILDQLLTQDEKNVDRSAADSYNRGIIAELQFQPLNALPDFERAYRYRPEVLRYGYRYGKLLLEQNDFRKAEPVFIATIDRARDLTKANPASYQSDLARNLNSLANLYSDTQRLKEAEEAYKEALGIWRDLAKANAQSFEPMLAMTLNNLGILYGDTKRFKEAQESYREALDIRTRLAETNLPIHLREKAMTMNNLSQLYGETGELQQAGELHRQVVDIYRKLAESNPAAYQPELAMSLANLGLQYVQEKRFKEADETLAESVQIRKQLAARNPSAYEPELAKALTAVGLFFMQTRRPTDAEVKFRDSLEIYRRLAKSNPAAYNPDVAHSLQDLALEHWSVKDLAQASKEAEESTAIFREAWKSNPSAYGDDLASSLYLGAKILIKEDPVKACASVNEASQVASTTSWKKMASVQFPSCKPNAASTDPR